MRRLRRTIETVNAELFNPAGLNILWPRDSAFLFVSTLDIGNVGIADRLRKDGDRVLCEWNRWWILSING
jgi:hypothetical protein